MHHIVAVDIFTATDNLLAKIVALLLVAAAAWGVYHVLKAAFKSHGSLGAIVGAVVAVIAVLFAIRYLLVAGRGADVAEDTAKEIGLFLYNPDLMAGLASRFFGA